MDNSTTLPSYSSTIELSTIFLPNLGNERKAGFFFKILLLALLSTLGTIGNVLVIVTIQKDRKLRIPGNFFLINLTVSDIIVTAFSIPVIIYNIVRDQNEDSMKNIERSGFCQTSAYLKVIALHVSWYSLAFIALNRYYSVCRMNEYANFFTKKRILVTVFLVWVWVILINIPIMVGWAVPSDKVLNENSTEGYYFAYPRHAPPVIYDRSSHDCVLGVNGQGGYTYANGFFVMSIPLVSIVFCYSLVYMEMVQSRRKMKGAINSKQMQRRYRKERKLSIMLAIVVLIFISCWVPAIIYDFASDVNEGEDVDWARLVFNWVALSNSAMNPGLYAILSKAFRQGYKKVAITILRKLLCCDRCKSSMDSTLRDLSNDSSTGTSTFRKVIPRVLVKKRARQHSEMNLSRLDSSFAGNDMILDSATAETTYFKEGRRASSDGRLIVTSGLSVPSNRVNGRWNRNSVLVHRAAIETKPTTAPDNKTEPGLNTTVPEITTEPELRNTTPELATDPNSRTTPPSSNSNSAAAQQTKKKFVALLDQLDASKDMFSAEGIYIGVGVTKETHTIAGGTKKTTKDAENADSEGELNDGYSTSSG